MPGPQPRIYALHKTGMADFPVGIESGSPARMAAYVDTSEDNEVFNFYGVLNDEARFVPLRLEVQELDGERRYVWRFMEAVFVSGADLTYHYAAGDIFAAEVFRLETGKAWQEEAFQDHVGETTSDLRFQCRGKGIAYYNTQPRTQLAMMLSAPIAQEAHCPDIRCAASLTARHRDECAIALCLYSGVPRLECKRKHVSGACGMDRWNGYEPGVLEGYVYSKTPEEIRAKGRWDPQDRVFTYDVEPQDIDETVVASGPDAVEGMLTELVDEAKAAAVQDCTTQNVAEQLGLPTATDQE